MPGPMVSISPTTAPAALSRLTSPARPELLVTVIVWVPVVAVDHSGAQSVRLTVTVLAAPVAAAGSAAIVTPAASAGTAIRTPATSHGRPAATRSQRGIRAAAAAVRGSGAVLAAGAAGSGWRAALLADDRAARVDEGGDDHHKVSEPGGDLRTVIFGDSSVMPVMIDAHQEPGSMCAVRSKATQAWPGSQPASCRSPRP